MRQLNKKRFGKNDLLLIGGLIAAAVVLFLIRGIFHGTAGAYVEVTVNGDVYGTYALKEDQHKDLVERMETRHGLRQLSYMKELHMGNDKYKLINIDDEDHEIIPKEAVKDVKLFEG